MNRWSILRHLISQGIKEKTKDSSFSLDKIKTLRY